MLDDKNFDGMEQPSMTHSEKEEAIDRLADYLFNSPDKEINTEAFCKACAELKYDPFAFLEDDLAKLENKLRALLDESLKDAHEWLEIDDTSLNRLALYLLSFGDGNIDTEVLYTACMACKLNPHEMTEAHLETLQIKLNEFEADMGGGSSASQSAEDVLDQVARYLVENTDGDITTDVLFEACNAFGVDPMMLSEVDMAVLQDKINAIADGAVSAPSTVIDDDALDRLARTILGSPVAQINVEVLYNACRTCNIDPYAMDDQAMMKLQMKLNELSGKA